MPVAFFLLDVVAESSSFSTLLTKPGRCPCLSGCYGPMSDDWQTKYEELREAVLNMYDSRNAATRMPYHWAIRESKMRTYRLKVLVGLVAEDKVPENLRLPSVGKKVP